MSTLVISSTIWAGSPLSACLTACSWDRSPVWPPGWQAFSLGSVGVWRTATVLQDLRGSAQAKYPPFGVLTWGVLPSSRGLHVAAFGGLLARSRTRRTISWGTRWGQQDGRWYPSGYCWLGPPFGALSNLSSVSSGPFGGLSGRLPSRVCPDSGQLPG